MGIALIRGEMGAADLAALFAHQRAVIAVLEAAGYVAQQEFSHAGFFVATMPDTGGCHVSAKLPNGKHDAYPGYRVALEAAGFTVTPLPIYSETSGNYLWDLWYVAPLEAAPDA